MDNNHFMPSEVARLILGYLIDNKFHQTFEIFMRECPDLAEYWRLLRAGRVPHTTFLCQSLIEILNEWAVFKRNAARIGPARVQPAPAPVHTQPTVDGTASLGFDLHSSLQAEGKITQGKDRENELASNNQALHDESSSRKKGGGHRKVSKPVRKATSLSLSPSTSHDPDPHVEDTGYTPPADAASTEGQTAVVEMGAAGDGHNDEVGGDVEAKTSLGMKLVHRGSSRSYARRNSGETQDFLDSFLEDTYFPEKLAEHINKALLETTAGDGGDGSAPDPGVTDGEADSSGTSKTGSGGPAQNNKAVDINHILEMTESDPAFHDFLQLFHQGTAIPISQLDIPELNMFNESTSHPHHDTAAGTYTSGGEPHHDTAAGTYTSGGEPHHDTAAGTYTSGGEPHHDTAAGTYTSGGEPHHDTAAGTYTSGGEPHHDTAAGTYSSGGEPHHDTAAGTYTSGGEPHHDTAAGTYTSGGEPHHDTAAGTYSSGGEPHHDTAAGTYTSGEEPHHNTAAGTYSSGGEPHHNTAAGTYSSGGEPHHDTAAGTYTSGGEPHTEVHTNIEGNMCNDGLEMPPDNTLVKDHSEQGLLGSSSTVSSGKTQQSSNTLANNNTTSACLDMQHHDNQRYLSEKEESRALEQGSTQIENQRHSDHDYAVKTECREKNIQIEDSPQILSGCTQSDKSSTSLAIDVSLPDKSTIASHLRRIESHEEDDGNEVKKTTSPAVPCDNTPNTLISQASPTQPLSSYSSSGFQPPDDNSLTAFSLIEKSIAEMRGEKFIHRSLRSSFSQQETYCENLQPTKSQDVLEAGDGNNEATEPKEELETGDQNNDDQRITTQSQHQGNLLQTSSANRGHSSSSTSVGGVSYPDAVLADPGDFVREKNMALLDKCLSKYLSPLSSGRGVKVQGGEPVRQEPGNCQGLETASGKHSVMMNSSGSERKKVWKGRGKKSSKKKNRKLESDVTVLQRKNGSEEGDVQTGVCDSNDGRDQHYNEHNYSVVDKDTCSCHTETCSCHKETCSCHKETCSCHKETCSCHTETCSCHKETCSCHKETCSCHKETCSCLKETCSCHKQTNSSVLDMKASDDVENSESEPSAHVAADIEHNSHINSRDSTPLICVDDDSFAIMPMSPVEENKEQVENKGGDRTSVDLDIFRTEVALLDVDVHENDVNSADSNASTNTDSTICVDYNGDKEDNVFVAASVSSSNNQNIQEGDGDRSNVTDPSKCEDKPAATSSVGKQLVVRPDSKVNSLESDDGSSSSHSDSNVCVDEEKENNVDVTTNISCSNGQDLEHESHVDDSNESHHTKQERNVARKDSTKTSNEKLSAGSPASSHNKPKRQTVGSRLLLIGSKPAQHSGNTFSKGDCGNRLSEAQSSEMAVKMYGQYNTLSSPPYLTRKARDDKSPRAGDRHSNPHVTSASLPADFGELSPQGPRLLRSPVKNSHSAFRPVLRRDSDLSIKSPEQISSPSQSAPIKRTVIAVNSDLPPFIPEHCKKVPSRRIAPKEVDYSTPSPLQEVPMSPLNIFSPSEPSSPVILTKDSNIKLGVMKQMTSPESAHPRESSAFQQEKGKFQYKRLPSESQSQGAQAKLMSPSELERQGIKLPPSPSRRKPKRIKPVQLASSVKKEWSSQVKSVPPIKSQAPSPLLDDAKIVSSTSDVSSASQAEVEAFRMLKSFLATSYSKPQPQQAITSTNQEIRVAKCGCLARDTCKHRKGKWKKSYTPKKHSTIAEADSPTKQPTFEHKDQGEEEKQISIRACLNYSVPPSQVVAAVSSEGNTGLESEAEVKKFMNERSDFQHVKPKSSTLQRVSLTSELRGRQSASPSSMDSNKSFAAVGVMEYMPLSNSGHNEKQGNEKKSNSGKQHGASKISNPTLEISAEIRKDTTDSMKISGTCTSPNINVAVSLCSEVVASSAVNHCRGLTRDNVTNLSPSNRHSVANDFQELDTFSKSVMSTAVTSDAEGPPASAPTSQINMSSSEGCIMTSSAIRETVQDNSGIFSNQNMDTTPSLVPTEKGVPLGHMQNNGNASSFISFEPPHISTPATSGAVSKEVENSTSAVLIWPTVVETSTVNVSTSHYCSPTTPTYTCSASSVGPYTAMLNAPMSSSDVSLAGFISGALRLAHNIEPSTETSPNKSPMKSCGDAWSSQNAGLTDGQGFNQTEGDNVTNAPGSPSSASMLRQAMTDCGIPFEGSNLTVPQEYMPISPQIGSLQTEAPNLMIPVSSFPRCRRKSDAGSSGTNSGASTPKSKRGRKPRSTSRASKMENVVRILPKLSSMSLSWKDEEEKLQQLSQAFNTVKILPKHQESPQPNLSSSSDLLSQVQVTPTVNGPVIVLPPSFQELFQKLLSNSNSPSPSANLSQPLAETGAAKPSNDQQCLSPHVQMQPHSSMTEVYPQNTTSTVVSDLNTSQPASVPPTVFYSKAQRKSSGPSRKETLHSDKSSSSSKSNKKKSLARQKSSLPANKTHLTEDTQSLSRLAKDDMPILSEIESSSHEHKEDVCANQVFPNGGKQKVADRKRRSITSMKPAKQNVKGTAEKISQRNPLKRDRYGKFISPKSGSRAGHVKNLEKDGSMNAAVCITKYLDKDKGQTDGRGQVTVGLEDKCKARDKKQKDESEGKGKHTKLKHKKNFESNVAGDSEDRFASQKGKSGPLNITPHSQITPVPPQKALKCSKKGEHSHESAEEKMTRKSQSLKTYDSNTEISSSSKLQTPSESTNESHLSHAFVKQKRKRTMSGQTPQKKRKVDREQVKLSPVKKSGGSSSTEVSGGSPSKKMSGGSANKEVSGGSSGKKVSSGTLSKKVFGESSSTEVSGGSSNKKVSGGNSSQKVSSGSSSTVMSVGSPSKLSGGSSGKKVSDGNCSNEVSSGSSSMEVSGGSPSKNVSGRISNEVSGGSSSKKVSGGSSSKKVSGESSSKKVSGGSSGKNVSGESSSKKVSGESSSKKVSGESSSKKVSGGSSSRMKNNIVCENTCEEGSLSGWMTLVKKAKRAPEPVCRPRRSTEIVVDNSGETIRMISDADCIHMGTDVDSSQQISESAERERAKKQLFTDGVQEKRLHHTTDSETKREKSAMSKEKRMKTSKKSDEKDDRNQRLTKKEGMSGKIERADTVSSLHSRNISSEDTQSQTNPLPYRFVGSVQAAWLQDMLKCLYGTSASSTSKSETENSTTRRIESDQASLKNMPLSSKHERSESESKTPAGRKKSDSRLRLKKKSDKSAKEDGEEVYDHDTDNNEVNILADETAMAVASLVNLSMGVEANHMNSESQQYDGSEQAQHSETDDSQQTQDYEYEASGTEQAQHFEADDSQQTQDYEYEASGSEQAQHTVQQLSNDCPSAKHAPQALHNETHLEKNFTTYSPVKSFSGSPQKFHLPLKKRLSADFLLHDATDSLVSQDGGSLSTTVNVDRREGHHLRDVKSAAFPRSSSSNAVVSSLSKPSSQVQHPLTMTALDHSLTSKADEKSQSLKMTKSKELHHKGKSGSASNFPSKQIATEQNTHFVAGHLDHQVVSQTTSAHVLNLHEHNQNHQPAPSTSSEQYVTVPQPMSVTELNSISPDLFTDHESQDSRETSKVVIDGLSIVPGDQSLVESQHSSQIPASGTPTVQNDFTVETPILSSRSFVLLADQRVPEIPQATSTPLRGESSLPTGPASVQTPTAAMSSSPHSEESSRVSQASGQSSSKSKIDKLLKKLHKKK